MRIIPRTVGWARWSAAAVVSAVLVGCGGGDEPEAGAGRDQVTVVASFYPLAEVAERVGGERVRVQDLTPAGSEPHDLELAPDDVDDLEDADLVLVLGRGFQPGVEQVAERREGATLALLDLLPIDEGGQVGGDHDDEGEEDHDDGEGGLDPHVWLDPTLMAAIVDEVTEALVAADPSGTEVYEAGSAAYQDELAELDERFDAELDDCDRSTIVVAHEAFGWLTRRYGLTQEGIAGLSPEAEPSPARLAELTELVEREGITTVFTETLVSPRVSEALAREAGVGVAVLDPIEGIAEDRLAAGATYRSVMEANLDVIATALGCR